MDEVVVIGAGHAGLAASRHLARRGIQHVVLERGRIGETWRTQRWDTFALNTPSWLNRLPDVDGDPGPRDAFIDAPTWVDHLAGYASRSALPVREGAEVTRLERTPGGAFDVRLGLDGEHVRTRAVIVAAGIQRQPRIPALARALPRDVRSLHTAEYRNATSLPAGAVLVVGAAQSGAQVAEDLLDAGRTVHLATSRVPRLRRRTRGRDTMELAIPAGFFDVTPEQLRDPAEMRLPQPLISGIGRFGHSLSLQWLEASGARLLGHLRAIDEGRLTFDDDLAANLRFGDETSAMANRQIAEGLAASGADADLPALEDDPADEPHPDPGAIDAPTSLDLAVAGISTVIWATGYEPSFPWLPAAIMDERGAPRHDHGATPMAGLFVLGFPWLLRRGSGVIYGADGDAATIVDAVSRHLAA